MTMFSEQTLLGFIGAGAVGGTLAVALAQAGYHVTAGASRISRTLPCFMFADSTPSPSASSTR